MEESTEKAYNVRSKFLIKAIRDSSDQVQEEIMENLEAQLEENQ